MSDAPSVTVEGEAGFGGGWLFSGLSLTAEAGRWTCLLGPSGVGKSTVLRLIAGIADEVAFEGRIAAGDGAPLDGRVAMMAQADLLMPWLDVTGNVLLGARLRGERADEARAREMIARVGLAEQAGQRPATLSGGERQRAALARTLMEDRPVILLDEPFSALDARRRAEMQDLAFRLLAGRTVVMVTHDPGEAARLGHAIRIMGPDGLSPAPVPPGVPPRAVDDPGALETQGRLLARLRAGA